MLQWTVSGAGADKFEVTYEMVGTYPFKKTASTKERNFLGKCQ
jgi:hypothetical protein